MIDTSNVSLPFYNMEADILFQGIVIKEKMAVKNLWEKNNDIIFDVYFYASKQTKIIAGAYIKSLKNLNNGKIYYNVHA